MDILLLIPIIIGAWRGFKKGFVIEIFTLLALLVGIYAGIHFSDYMATILRDSVGIESEYLPAIAFTITFLLVGAMVYFLGKLIEKGLKIVALGMVNKIAGLFFGVVKMVFFLSAALVILESYDEKGKFIPANLKTDSLLYEPIKKTSLTAIPALKYSDLFIKMIDSGDEEDIEETDNSENIEVNEEG
ncbi:MAG: CvpA family protein [Crocinitomix sp.]|nr:CvpA family protein [Crocinitomix sp.]